MPVACLTALTMLPEEPAATDALGRPSLPRWAQFEGRHPSITVLFHRRDAGHDLAGRSRHRRSRLPAYDAQLDDRDLGAQWVPVGRRPLLSETSQPRVVAAGDVRAGSTFCEFGQP
jgi:hypothetical protein